MVEYALIAFRSSSLMPVSADSRVLEKDESSQDNVYSFRPR